MVQMETNSPGAYHGTNESRFPPGETKKPQIQWTSEEIRVLRDCNKESFYYRCLPLALAGMTAAYLAVKRGILTGHPKYGAAYKMTGAAFAGWFAGKISYRSKCEEKFLKLENSAIANVLRKKRGYFSETFDSETSQFSDDEDLALKDNNYTTYSSGDFHSSSRSLNFDKNVPFSELDDRDRPTMDGANVSEQSQPVIASTTYDELRRRNREEYEKQHRQPESSRSTYSADSSSRPWGQTNFESQIRTNVGSKEDTPKNAYGDSWDNPKFA